MDQQIMVYIVDYYSVIIRNEVLTRTTMGDEPQKHTKFKKSDIEDHTL